jgi:hypothetical protein
MHQQIRTRPSRSQSTDGPGAMSFPPIEGDPVDMEAGALDSLLDLLASEGYNLCLAGGSGMDGGGEFVFAIDHEDGEDKTAECASMLISRGYQGVRLVAPHVCWVDDRPGALRECLREAGPDREIREIFVGTPKDGRVLVHATTVRRRMPSGA